MRTPIFLIALAVVSIVPTKSAFCRDELKVNLAKLREKAAAAFKKEEIISSPAQMKDAKIYFQEAYEDAEAGHTYRDASRFIVLMSLPDAPPESPRMAAFVLTVSGKTETQIIDTSAKSYPAVGDLFVYGTLQKGVDPAKVDKLTASIKAVSPNLTFDSDPGFALGVRVQSPKTEGYLEQALAILKNAKGEGIFKEVYSPSLSKAVTNPDGLAPLAHDPKLVSTQEKTVGFDEMKEPGFAPDRLFKQVMRRVPPGCRGLIVLGKQGIQG